MDWIFEHFQILALVGLALASWLKARSDAKAAEREERRAREEMAEPPEEEIFGDAEEWQEPQWPTPPPPLVRSVPPPYPAEAVIQPAAESEAVLKRQFEMQERLRQLRESKVATTGGAAATRARNLPAEAAGKPAAAAGSALKAALRDRNQTRRAILMREILGPPLGLR